MEKSPFDLMRSVIGDQTTKPKYRKVIQKVAKKRIKKKKKMSEFSSFFTWIRRKKERMDRMRDASSKLDE